MKDSWRWRTVVSRGTISGRRAKRWAGLSVIGALVVALAALPAAAVAVSQPQLPFRCFAQVGVDHVVFGPDSFFLPNTVQGPTSFRENAGPTIVTYPLYRGTSQGRRVLYVITDASDLSVARALGVNYVPKLARAAGTAAVENSPSEIGSGKGIAFPASVDFSPSHGLVPGPSGFPPPRPSRGLSARRGTARSFGSSSAARRSFSTLRRSRTRRVRPTRSCTWVGRVSAIARPTGAMTTRASITRRLTPRTRSPRRSRT